MVEKDIRVWVVNPSSSNPSEDFQPRLKDIVIIFEEEFQGLSKIYGHQGSEMAHSMRFFDQAIIIEMLRGVFANDESILKVAQHRFALQLSQVNWQKLRALIIRFNPELEEVIEYLEALQIGYPILANTIAILFDAVRTALQIFNHAKTSAGLKAMDAMRDSLDADEQITLPQMVQNIKEALTKSEIEGQPVSQLKGRRANIYEGYRQNFNQTESFGIEQDFQNSDPNLRRDVSNVPFDMRQNMVDLFDTESDRQLTLYMAHRRGEGESDLAASDLIYINEEYQFIIFVQYKRLSESYTVQLKAKEEKQFNKLLAVCDAQVGKCTNFSQATKTYVPEQELRLVDCPVFYKFIGRDGVISPFSKGMPGQYMPACLLHHLLDASSSNRRKEILSRAFSAGTFHGMVRRANIGSRASEFDVLYDLVEEQLGLVIAVESST